MDNYELKSSQETQDPQSPICSFNKLNTFVVNKTTENTELIKAYFTNPRNGSVIEDTVEVNALIWAQGEYIDRCFEISEILSTQLRGLSVIHNLLETTVIDIWESKRDGLCNFKVTRKLPTVFIVLSVVLKSGRNVSDGAREFEGHKKKRDKRGSRKIGLVLDDTVNIKKYNRK